MKQQKRSTREFWIPLPERITVAFASPPGYLRWKRLFDGPGRTAPVLAAEHILAMQILRAKGAARCPFSELQERHPASAWAEDAEVL